MATELKTPEQPTYGELQVYVDHVEGGSVVRSTGSAVRDQQIVKVHNFLRQLARGERRRRAA